MTEDQIRRRVRQGNEELQAQLAAGEAVFDGDTAWSSLMKDLASEAVADAAPSQDSQ